MSGDATTSSGDTGDLVEPEGVNAGPPVDAGAPAAEAGRPERPDSPDSPDRPEPPEDGQGTGEMLSRPGSDHGQTHPGPGQELSAEEG